MPRIFRRRRAFCLTIALTVACVAPALGDDQGNTFVRAAESGDLATVNALLKSGIDVNVDGSPKPGYARSTALIEASRSARLEVVQALLAAKADPNLTGMNGTALEAAAGKSDLRSGTNVEIVRALLAAGADPNMDRAIPPLSLAALHGNAEVVRALIAAKARVDGNGKGKGTLGSPLFLASEHHRLDVVRELLAGGANVNAIQKPDGTTALLASLVSPLGQDVAVTRAFIEGGANVNAMTYSGVSPLMIAAARGNVEIVQALLAANADVDGGFKVCAGFEPPARSTPPLGSPAATAIPMAALAGGSPLGAAVIGGNVNIVQALIAAKADLNRVQCDGKTALQLAAENNHSEVAKLLTSAGAKTR